MKKVLIYLLLIVVITTAGASAYGYHQYQQFLDQAVFKTTPVTLNINKGSNFTQFVQQVKQKGGQGHELNWKVMARLNNLGNSIKAGEYEITTALKPAELIDHIKNNLVKTYSITLVEGQNWQEIKAKFMTSELRQSMADLNDEQLIGELGIEANHLEGQFLPETYQFTKSDDAIDVLTRAHDDLNQVIQQAWDNRDKNINLQSPYELLVLASIIEKETAEASERTTISGVFHRRLNKGMRLQTDPTVIYGVGAAYAGDITSAHLRTDTPYNTYTRKGLPPTPIAMASQASIEAAAHPKDGKVLYFVANNMGGHKFSETYAEHQRAVADYLKGLKVK